MIALLLQKAKGYTGYSRYATPYDSTQGVLGTTYIVGAVILLLFVVGVLKAYWDDKSWRARVFGLENDDAKPGGLREGKSNRSKWGRYQ